VFLSSFSPENAPPNLRHILGPVGKCLPPMVIRRVLSFLLRDSLMRLSLPVTLQSDPVSALSFPQVFQIRPCPSSHANTRLPSYSFGYRFSRTVPLVFDSPLASCFRSALPRFLSQKQRVGLARRPPFLPSCNAFFERQGPGLYFVGVFGTKSRARFRSEFLFLPVCLFFFDYVHTPIFVVSLCPDTSFSSLFCFFLRQDLAGVGLSARTNSFRLFFLWSCLSFCPLPPMIREGAGVPALAACHFFSSLSF